MPRHALRPLAAPDRDHAYVLAGVDVGDVGGQLVADVVAQRLLEHVHAREPAAGGDVLTQGRLPRARRRVERLAAQERREVLALVLDVVALERLQPEPRAGDVGEQPAERRIAEVGDGVRGHHVLGCSARYFSTASISVSVGMRTAVSSARTSSSSAVVCVVEELALDDHHGRVVLGDVDGGAGALVGVGVLRELAELHHASCGVGRDSSRMLQHDGICSRRRG